MTPIPLHPPLHPLLEEAGTRGEYVGSWLGILPPVIISICLFLLSLSLASTPPPVRQVDSTSWDAARALLYFERPEKGCAWAKTPHVASGWDTSRRPEVQTYWVRTWQFSGTAESERRSRNSCSPRFLPSPILSPFLGG